MRSRVSGEVALTWRVAQRLHPGVRAGGTARSFCTRRLLSVLDDVTANDLVADVATITHELVLNAVNAGATLLELTMSLAPGRVRVDVVDDAPGMPELQASEPAAQRGRGLQIVDALAADWGVSPCDQRQKAVWAEVAVPTLRARGAG